MTHMMENAIRVNAILFQSNQMPKAWQIEAHLETFEA